MRVLNAFGIKYCVLHDADTGNPSEEAENCRIAAAVEATFGSIECIEPDFEGVAGIPEGAKARLGKPFAACEHFRDPQNPVPELLAQSVRRAYA